jgi:dipeptidase D
VSNAIRGLTPQAVWEHFESIAAIPRPSKKEEKIARHIVGLAKNGSFEVHQDRTGNILVQKAASPGKESSPVIVLQSHIDMVCEKNKDVKHDFDHDGISLVRTDGHITANGTTLGSDNGIGVAAALSVMLDSSLVHGPLELLFTVDEETGLTGAQGLAPEFLRGRTLLNLDSEEDGTLYVGCSGGRDTLLTFPVERRQGPVDWTTIVIEVAGLKGGHSGLEIHAGRGNAIRLLARTLSELSRTVEFSLTGLQGGSKRNAIPREAEALLLIPTTSLSDVQGAVKTIESKFRSEHGRGEPGIAVRVRQSRHAQALPFTAHSQATLIDILHALPHGVLGMSADIPDLVETSTNVATIVTDGDTLLIGTSQRSSVASLLDNAVKTVASIGRMGGATIECTDGYPGWKPNLDSSLLKTTQRAYRELFQRDAAVKAIHAGLECGIIGERYPGMDMISFGPTILGAHSPDERIEIVTVQRFWDLLVRVLEKLT